MSAEEFIKKLEKLGWILEEQWVLFRRMKEEDCQVSIVLPFPSWYPQKPVSVSFPVNCKPPKSLEVLAKVEKERDAGELMLESISATFERSLLKYIPVIYVNASLSIASSGKYFARLSAALSSRTCAYDVLVSSLAYGILLEKKNIDIFTELEKELGKPGLFDGLRRFLALVYGLVKE
ncbi:MAG: hypothetical protein QXJ59_08565 [Thermofilaceae archaeon]